jgi:hypothetical protein
MTANQVAYRILNPAETHFRPATCAEVNCDHYLNGWRVRIDSLPPELVHAARTSGRLYEELRVAEGETYLVFEAGQACFKASQHRTNVGRTPLYVVDTPTDNGRARRRIHTSNDSWADDLHSHTDALLGAINKG